MTLDQLNERLVRLNVRLQADGEHLRIAAPPGALDAALRDALQRHKAALLLNLHKVQAKQSATRAAALVADVGSLHEPFALSEVQHAYWVGRSAGIELGGVATHYYYELSCDELDIERFERAFQRLIQRHHMLRAVVDDAGRQRILETVPAYLVSTLDLRGQAAQDQDDAMAALRAQLSHRTYAADQWPLFDIRAVRLADQHTRLYFSWDFLHLDAWSLYRLCREWHTLYSDLDAALPPLRISYRDYALAEQALRDSGPYRRDRDYWWNRLDTLPGAPSVPVLSASRADDRPASFTRRRFRMASDKWNALKARSRAAGLTPSGILLAAFAEVLAYWSKERHFVLNMTTFNRRPLHEDVGRLVGDFTSLTLLEVDFRSRAAFRDRAAALHGQFLQDIEHQLVSGVEVMREWNKRRGRSLRASMPVVFTSCLVLAHGDEGDANAIESFGRLGYGISQTPQVWLDNQVSEDRDGLALNWDARDGVFEPDVLQSMFDCYGRFLEALAASNEPWEQAHPLSLPADQQLRRETVNATAATVYAPLLHEGFMDRALAHPDATALITSECRVSYGELLSRSAGLANQLVEQGVRGGGQRVLVAIEKGWEQVLAVLGVLMAGGAYVPLDPTLPKARRQQIAEASGATHAVVLPGQGAGLELPGFVQFVETNVCANVAPVSGRPVLRQRASDLAYVIFTSGSTGTPKGVMIDHRGAVNTVLHVNRHFDVGWQDKVLAVSSLGFDLSVFDIFGLLSAGGCVVIPDAQRSSDPAHWHELMSAHGVTLWNSAPALMNMLVAHLEAFHQAAHSGVRLALVSGDWVPVGLKAKMDVLMPNARLISLGGATEASVWSVWYPVDHVDPAWTSIPYGKPMPNQTMHVLNSALQPCPEHVTGQIAIGGLGLAIGYLGDDEKTQSRFVWEDGQRYYLTGDLGRYLPDGNIEFLGREDAQVKVRGHRVELGEVAAAFRSHPGVDEAMVVATQARGLCAYLRLAPGQGRELTRLVDAGHRQLSLDGLLEAVDGDAAWHGNGARSLQAGALWGQLDRLYFECVAEVLGSALAGGGWHALDGLMQSLRVVPRYRRWLQRALQSLVQQGVVWEDGGRFQQVMPLKPSDRSRLLDDIHEGLRHLFGFTEREACWFTAASRSLADILSETLHSAQLYTEEETELIYQKLFAAGHAQLSAFATALRPWAQVRPLRVVEVGAGLGSATRHVLAALDGHCAQYDFTDISGYFLKRARDKFGHHGFVRYETLDLDIDPMWQGFDEHSYDVVVASSVLHDVRDVVGTLRRLLGLLAPGGVLVLLEETRFFPSFDLTMGLQQGFDVFGDEPLRTHHPLLTGPQWRACALEAGFASVHKLRAHDDAAQWLGFEVLVAQAPAGIEVLDEEKLNAHVLQRLPAYMQPALYRRVHQFPLTANGKVDMGVLAKTTRTAGAQRVAQPTNETEQALVSIWRDVLGHADFGLSSSFFDVGGDSLLLTEVRNSIFRTLGMALPMTSLFEHPTVSSLARRIADERAPKSSELDTARGRAQRQREAMRKQRAAHTPTSQ